MIKQPKPKEELKEYTMEKIERNIIYAKITFTYNQWATNRKDLKYYYILRAKLDYKTDDITRDKYWFSENTRFFDTPRIFKFGLISYESKYENPLTKYYSFFLSSFLNKTPLLNDSVLFRDLFKFYHSCKYDVHYATLFETFEHSLA